MLVNRTYQLGPLMSNSEKCKYMRWACQNFICFSRRSGTIRHDKDQMMTLRAQAHLVRVGCVPESTVFAFVNLLCVRRPSKTWTKVSCVATAHVCRTTELARFPPQRKGAPWPSLSMRVFVLENDLDRRRSLHVPGPSVVLSTPGGVRNSVRWWIPSCGTTLRTCLSPLSTTSSSFTSTRPWCSWTRICCRRHSTRRPWSQLQISIS